jgi:hypothetical protein
MKYKFYKQVDQSIPLILEADFDDDQSAINSVSTLQDGEFLVEFQVYKVIIVNESVSHDELVYKGL